MHETDQLRSSQRGAANASQTEYHSPVPELTAPTNLTPSSSRPPPAHPILKKPRGPSSSGPRPTARFVDVPDSEEENSVQSSSSQQSGNISQPENSTKGRNAASRSRSPAKPEKKLSAGKKFVASTTTSKRRPVLPRRQSSQSSTGSAGSDAASRESNASITRQCTSQGSNSSSRDSSPARKQVSSGVSTYVEGQGSKNKAPEKRPASEASPEKRFTARPGPQFNSRNPNATASRMTSSPLAQEQTTTTDAPVRPQIRQERTSSRASDMQPQTMSPQTMSPQTMSASEKSTKGRATDSLGIYSRSPELLKSKTAQTKVARSEDTSMAARDENAATLPGTPIPARMPANSNGAPPMARSKSNNESKRPSPNTVPTANFKSPSVVGMSSIAVAGGFDFETPRARLLEDELPVLGADQPDLRKPSVLDSRLAPTQPSSAPAPPMARSKSQLTLLLERDKARIGDKQKVGSTSSQKSGGKSDTPRPNQ